MLVESQPLCNALCVVIAIDTKRTPAATIPLAALLVVVVLGCGSGTDAVPVPGADDVVTAPVATADMPPVQTSPATNPPTSSADDSEPQSAATTTPATTTSAPTPPAPATAATPPATEPPDDDVFLRLGDEGPLVASMQSKLASIDYLSSGFEPGVFDDSTRLGLRRFQGDYGLGVDGIFGPITLRALNAAVSSIGTES